MTKRYVDTIIKMAQASPKRDKIIPELYAKHEQNGERVKIGFRKAGANGRVFQVDIMHELIRVVNRSNKNTSSYCFVNMEQKYKVMHSAYRAWEKNKKGEKSYVRGFIYLEDVQLR